MKFTLRKLVLRILPHNLVRSLKKKANFNYLFFGPSQKNIGLYIINDVAAVCPMYNMEEKLGKEVVEGFKACFEEYESREDLLRKYVLLVEDCIIEPEFGWGITVANDQLLFDSIPNNSWRETYHPNYLKYKRHKDQAVRLEEAVSINILRGGENNYWHFLHDLLGEVTLALKALPPGIPFLISKNLSEKPYFKQALQQSSRLATLNWIVRDKEYLLLKKAWFLQPMPNSNEQFYDVQKLLEIPDASSIKANRKVFLTRSSKRIRYLTNSSEIEAIAAKQGFEIIDTDGYSLQEQIKLFSETLVLIGIHGAGLTNVLYRKNAPMYVLELLPKDYLQPHYFWLSKGMGHEYESLVGSVSQLNTSFEIDAVLFEAKVSNFLDKNFC